MIGSVFSPYYAWARARGHDDPEHFCALNVALYGDCSRWAMTERGRNQIKRTPDTLTIAASHLHWEGDTLVIAINETTAPIPRPLRGEVRVHPQMLPGHRECLDGQGRHFWWPVAPRARVEVKLTHPQLAWSGVGYHDSNWGDEPLANGFADWDWSRAKLRDGSAVVYDVRRRNGEEHTFALRFDPQGGVEPFALPPRLGLPKGRWWRVARSAQSDANTAPQILQTLEDTPFYVRSTLQAQWLGEPVTAVHESLSLDRFTQPWVQLLLPFRMPRWAR